MSDQQAPPPASAAWRPGDPPGHRRFLHAFENMPLRLEAGATLGEVTVAYETWGTLDARRSNAVLVLHALTGDSHACGPREPGHPSPGWWDTIIGPGKAVDTNRSYVVCPNVLGGCQGTTGPSSDAPDGRRYGSRFPRLTIRDHVAVQVAVADALGIDRWAAVMGGSMGGMQALEWVIVQPDRVRTAIVIGCGVAATAEQIALCALQIRAIREDPGFRGGEYYDAPDGHGPHRGLSLARGIGQVSYRCEPELQVRFGREPQDDERPLAGGRYAVESYLEHHGDKLARRFDANTYVVLSEAMNHHDVGRGRGGAEAALARVGADVVVVGMDSDRLYPLWQQHELVSLLPGRSQLAVVSSLHGHDGFLIQWEEMGKVIADALD